MAIGSVLKKKARGIRDSRGKMVPSASLSALAGTDADRSERRSSLVQRLRRETRDAVWQIAGANAAGLMLSAFVLSKAEDALLGKNTLVGMPRAGAIVVLLALVIAIMWWQAVRSMRRKRARRAVEAAFCGSCGYDLAALEPETDGCVVCPECASAWRRRSK